MHAARISHLLGTNDLISCGLSEDVGRPANSGNMYFEIETAIVIPMENLWPLLERRDESKIHRAS